MNETPAMVVSVHGEPRRTVPPDSAVSARTIAVTRQSKAEAVRAAAAAMEGLTADLAEISGARGVDTLRRPLTWPAQSAATRQEHAHDKLTGQYEPTGEITATVAVQITVRTLQADGFPLPQCDDPALAVHQVRDLILRALI